MNRSFLNMGSHPKGMGSGPAAHFVGPRIRPPLQPRGQPSPGGRYAGFPGPSGAITSFFPCLAKLWHHSWFRLQRAGLVTGTRRRRACGDETSFRPDLAKLWHHCSAVSPSVGDRLPSGHVNHVWCHNFVSLGFGEVMAPDPSVSGRLQGFEPPPADEPEVPSGVPCFHQYMPSLSRPAGVLNRLAARWGVAPGIPA